MNTRITVAALMMLTTLPLLAQKISYPETRRVDQVDTYFGEKVADPYRWLEDENAPETAHWVAAQNAVTNAYFEQIPYRAQIRRRLETLYNYPRYGAPFRRGEHFVFSKNDGLQNQSVYYIQKGLDGTPELLLDPNTFSKDGTSQLGGLAMSKDGHYLAYGISVGGSDWREVHVMEVATRRVLPDVLRWVKVSGMAWQGDGFYYSRYDAPAEGKELSSSNDDHKVFYHRVNTAQAADELVFEDKAHPQRFHQVDTTEDERFAILNVSDRGKGLDGNALFYREAGGRGTAPWLPLVPTISNDTFELVDNIGDKILVSTNHGAPNGKAVLIDPKNPAERSWVAVLAERPEPLESIRSAGGKIFASYLKDVATKAYVFDRTGRQENEITLPGIGTAAGFGGNADDVFIFYTFNSFNYPASIFRYDIATKKSTRFRSPEIPGFHADAFETKQVFVTSKDGTRVPMFIVAKKGLILNGNNPTVMYGYGGFSVNTNPSFSSLRIALLEQGVVYASVNMRGGAEYGETWHQGGMKLNKQNVFDDFIAAAEWLVANKYTSAPNLAIQGASNGGLLVGAVANQRPDLFKAVIQQAGVMDMLRFHKFTIGWNWIADYGSSEASAEEFKALRAYSPIHNLKNGASYPATLTTTADHDDRVVPAHSFKYAAALQHAQGGSNPVLIRIDTNSGHGASSTTKAIEQTGDIDAFIFKNLGVTPKY
jgi:prolyl oligopeptidase